MRPLILSKCQRQKRWRGRKWRACAVLACGCREMDAVLVRPSDDNRIWPAFPINGLGSLPTASFAELDLMGPNLTLHSGREYPDVKFPRGRHEPTRTYIGLEMWNSRGDMPARKAVLAMLGDEYAYYESPLFTAYKLMALGRVHELPDRVFRNAGKLWEQWNYGYPHGYNSFWADVASRAHEEAFLRRFPRATSEAEAVVLAKALLDSLFTMPARELRDTYLGYKYDDLARKYSDDPFYRMVDPSFVVFSMLSYRNAAQMYGVKGEDSGGGNRGGDEGGSSVLVLAPEARLRGMDGNFFKLQECAVAWADDPAVKPLSQTTFSSLVSLLFDDMCICDDEDFTEVFTPGYHLPSHVLGYEAEGRAFYTVKRHCDDCGYGYGGYGGGDDSGSGGEMVLVAMLESVGRCVTQLVHEGPFYFCTDNECRPEDRYCGPVPVAAVRPLQPIFASGVIYALPRISALRDGSDAAGAAAAAAAAAVARTLLVELNAASPPRAASPFDAAPELLLDLLDMEFTSGGQPHDVFAVLVGQGGKPVEVMLSMAALPQRPLANETLLARRRAAGSGGAVVATRLRPGGW
ncbi:unnamed protein product [Phaeothamnion confervicola]